MEPTQQEAILLSDKQENNESKQLDNVSKPKTPGSFQAKVGWHAFSNLPNPGDEQKLETLTEQLGLETLIDMYKPSTKTKPDVDDLAHYLFRGNYGEWYHNTGVLLFTVVFTYLLTKLGCGIMGCLVIGGFLTTYYQSSMRRLRRNVRDDIQRELAINRLETEDETAGWINHFMSRFWLIYEPVLSAQITGTADAILIENTPSFLDSIRLTSFTLGTKAPLIEGIKTITKTEPNIACMDWKFSFSPTDTTDLTSRDLRSKINPKIVLTIRLGKGMLGAGMPILLEDLSFKGHLRLKFKMFNEFPHIKTVEASFLEKPHFDYCLKPVGGETFGFDINNIPGLQSFIQEQVHATLGPMMYAPNVYTLDVAGMMDGSADLDSANGVLIVKIHSASGLKASDLFGTLDPYIIVRTGIATSPEHCRTKHFENNMNPKFDEALFVLLNNVNTRLFLEVVDRNTNRTDTSIGIAHFELSTLQESENIVEGLTLPVLRKGKIAGEIKCDLQYFPINKPDKEEDGTIIPAVESNSGILRFTVHECKDLSSRSKGISPYAVMKMNGIEKLRTKAFKRSINPRWDKTVECFIADKSKLALDLNILDADHSLGSWSSTLLNAGQQEWWNLKDNSGKVHISMLWKPVTMTGFNEGFGHGVYRPPIGVIRVHFFGAVGLKNVEAMTGGKSDPYVRIMSGVQNRGQTDYIDDDLNPEWNQILYVPVHSIREDLIFEVMDYNENTKDKSLGMAEFVLKDIIKQVKQEGQIIYEALESLDRTVNLLSLDRKKGRGNLHYQASFFPTLALAKEESTKEQEEEHHVHPQDDQGDQGDQVDCNSNASSEPVLIEKPKVWPEQDLHNHIIRYTNADQERKQIDLASYESGILAVNIQSVTFTEPHRAVIVELFLDSNHSQYRTIQQKGSHLKINETGTVFVKEMDFSKLVVNVRQARDKENNTKKFGRCSFEVSKMVRNSMQLESGEYTEHATLLDCPGGKVKLGVTFIPIVQFKLDPRESLENQGHLTVTAVKANDLMAADKSGTSDVFIRFYLNDQRVFKTQTYKKTLNPVFGKDEKFTLPVHDRTVAHLVAKIFDWDQIGKDTLLGECTIPFTGDEIETFRNTTKELVIPDRGRFTVALLWRPELVARKRTNTSLFSATTRVFTHAPSNAFGAGKDAGGKVIGAGTKVFGTGVSAIGSGIRGIGKMGRSSSTSSNSIISKSSSNNDIPPVPVIPLFRDLSSDFSESAGDIEEGAMVNITIIEARNLKAMDRGGTSDPYCRVHMRNKAIYKTRHLKKTLSPDWSESFNCKVTSSSIDFKVKDHNKLNNDVDIGEHHLQLFENVKHGQAFDGWLPLVPEGTGELHVRVALVDSDVVSIASKSSRSSRLFGRR